MTDRNQPSCRSRSTSAGHRCTPSGQVTCGADRMGDADDASQRPGLAVDVTVIDFAAHTAYLDPLSGAGLLLLPPPHDDVVADPAPVDLGLPEDGRAPAGRGPRSLHRADWEYALDELERIGWILFDDEYGEPEVAGRTGAGRVALCLFGDGAVVSEPSLAEIERALSALRSVADVRRQ